MRQRHRIPSIFSMSMLDVLCCALGAVILLMLLNFVTAYNKAQALTVTETELKKSNSLNKDNQANLQLVRSDLATSLDLVEQLKGQVGKLTNEVNTSQKLASLEKEVYEARLKKLQLELTSAQNLLKQAQADREATEALLAEARTGRQEAMNAAKAARTELSKQNEKLSATVDRIPELQKSLTDSMKRSEKAQDRVVALEADLLKLRKLLEEAGIKLTNAEKEKQAALDAVKLDADTLRKLLADQQATSGRLRTQLQIAANRFAGIDLSGKRVVFLVDMSGSMGAIDTNTLEPSKWPTVCQTVQQVLKSMPDVEKFQVIVFSDKVDYPLGKAGDWIDFDRVQSPDATLTALTRVKPEGNTQMYAAFEAAFKYRSIGLDTIYLFSDGLPNIGPGLPANPPSDETAQGALLGNHLREAIKKQWNTASTRVRIHAVGFFYESPALGAFLWGLTRENGGNFVGMSKP
ncbi:MAG: VWA domain-containing protein [Gemmatales bacterium]